MYRLRWQGSRLVATSGILCIGPEWCSASASVEIRLSSNLRFLMANFIIYRVLFILLLRNRIFGRNSPNVAMVPFCRSSRGIQIRENQSYKCGGTPKSTYTHTPPLNFPLTAIRAPEKNFPATCQHFDHSEQDDNGTGIFDITQCLFSRIMGLTQIWDSVPPAPGSREMQGTGGAQKRIESHHGHL